MRKRFLTTLAFLGAPLLFAACAIAGSTGADRMRRACIVLFLIASIGCSGGSPVAPSPVAEIGATSTTVAVALEAPVRRITHHTTGWTFNLKIDGRYQAHVNKYRSVEFTTPETGDEGTHWYVQFRSIETYNGQPHERGSLSKPTREGRVTSTVFGRMCAMSFGHGPTRRRSIISTRSDTT